MKIKIKTVNAAGISKAENTVTIKEVMINEDFLHPNNEAIAIGFQNKDTSGIIEFTTKEFDKFANTVKRKVHLIKSVKAFGREGAVNLQE